MSSLETVNLQPKKLSTFTLCQFNIEASSTLWQLYYIFKYVSEANDKTIKHMTLTSGKTLSVIFRAFGEGNSFFNSGLRPTWESSSVSSFSS